MDKERLFRNLERKYCSKCELTVSLPLGVDTDEIRSTEAVSTE